MAMVDTSIDGSGKSSAGASSGFVAASQVNFQRADDAVSTPLVWYKELDVTRSLVSEEEKSGARCTGRVDSYQLHEAKRQRTSA